MTTDFEDGDRNWDKVSPEYFLESQLCPQMHAWLLLPAEALGDGMSSPPSEQPLPWTLMDEDALRHLPEHGVCQVSGSKQVLE
jgi:hypothetical protein